MRKLQNAYLSILLVAGLGFLGSCSDDAEKPEQKPVVELGKESGSTYEDKTVPAGEPVSTTVTAYTGTPGVNLARLTVTRSINGTTPHILLDSALNKEGIVYVLKTESPLIEGTARYDFKVTDARGHYSNTSYTVTTFNNNNSGSLDIFNNVVLGSHKSATPGFLATNTGIRYDRQTALYNQKNIDFVFFSDASGPALAAPNDADAMALTEFRLNSWQKRNITKFSTTNATKADFDLVNNTRNLLEIYSKRSTLSPETRVRGLMVGQVIGFQTVTGKRGLLLVENIAAGPSGNITVDIKVEKTYNR